MVTEDKNYNDLLFINLIKMLEMAAGAALGKVDDPVTKTKKTDLDIARINIDMLAMLKEKTVNNVPPEVGEYLKNLVAGLQMEFISAKNKIDKTGPAGDVQSS